MSKGLPFSIEYLTSSFDAPSPRTPSPVDIPNIPKDLEESPIFTSSQQSFQHFPDTLPRLPADIDVNSLSMIYGGEFLSYPQQPASYSPPHAYNAPPQSYHATTPTPSESASSETLSSASSDCSPPSVSGSPKAPKKKTSKKDEKPEISYITLISMAILNAPDRKIVLSDIYQYIMDNHYYYNNTDKAWRNSIRHNLSLNECFIKCGRSDSGKGNFWTIHPACIEDFERGDFRRRNARRRAKRGCRDLSLPDIPAPSVPVSENLPHSSLPYFKPYPVQYPVPSSHPYPSMYYPNTSSQMPVPPTNMYHSGPYLNVRW